MNRLPIEPSFWAIPPFVSLLTLFGLAGLALIKGRGQKINLLLSAICILGGLLSLDKALASVLTDPALVLRISRIDHAFVVFFIPVYLHFTYAFLKMTRQRWVVVIAYAFSGCLSLFTQGEYYIAGVTQYFFGYYARGGPLIYGFGAASTLSVVFCLYLLFRGLDQEQDPDRKNKIKYIILGLGMAALLAQFDLLPLAGIASYPLGNLVFIPMFILGFAVLKHDLLDLGFVIQKGLIYSMLTGLLTGSYALMIIAFGRIFEGTGRTGPVYFSILFFLVIVFVFGPLKDRIQLFIDRFFFKDKYDYQKALVTLSDTLASVLRLDEIVEKVLEALTDVMHLDWGYVMLPEQHTDRFQVHSHMGAGSRSEDLSIFRSSPLIHEMGRRRREVTRYNVEAWSNTSWDPSLLKEEFVKLGGTVIVPMIFKAQVNGLLVLGSKKSGGLFTSEDFELLRTLANQCAISIENARAYQLIEDMNVKLENMVDERTEELKKALEEKEQTQDLLVRSESLASVGALVAGVAHELNNPIASVSSLVQSAVETIEEMRPEEVARLERGAGDLDELIDDLKFSLKELNRAGGIISSLLGISRQTQEYSEPVAINDVCKDALKVLQTQNKSTGIEIVEVYDKRVPEIRGNFANLGQVCLNILGNAIQVVDKRYGKIVMKTRHDRQRSKVVLECEDNGPGISEEHMKDIFKPFFTTKEVGKGTGLGLYISHEIVRRHNGHIFVRNNRHGGATFSVEFPEG